MKIIIPMAGKGSRFKNCGYNLPKPFIDVDGQPMISMVIDNLKPKNLSYEFIFIALKEHVEKYFLEEVIQTKLKNYKIVTVEKITEGAAQTVLLASHLFDIDEEVLIANCDQFIDIEIEKYLSNISKFSDGDIQCMYAKSPKWSYIEYKDNLVERVVEKEVISDVATTGLYWFKSGKICRNYLEKLVKNNIKSKGEFYVAPAYNLLIEDGLKVTFSIVGNDSDVMYGTGTPDNLIYFLDNLKRLKFYSKPNL